MKYTRPNGSVVEGTPEEIATYHLRMTGREKVEPKEPKQVKKLVTLEQEDLFGKQRATGYHRATWKSPERKRALELFHEHKKYKRIATLLFKERLSPFRRTPAAVSTELFRMLEDPNRR